MFRETLCSSSGESIVSILPDRHTGQSPTQSDIYQMLYWYNLLSWWWAQGCSKHVENRNKNKRSCGSVGYLLELYRDARSPEYKILLMLLPGFQPNIPVFNGYALILEKRGRIL